MFLTALMKLGLSTCGRGCLLTAMRLRFNSLSSICVCGYPFDRDAAAQRANRDAHLLRKVSRAFDYCLSSQRVHDNSYPPQTYD